MLFSHSRSKVEMPQISTIVLTMHQSGEQIKTATNLTKIMYYIIQPRQRKQNIKLKYLNMLSKDER